MTKGGRSYPFYSASSCLSGCGVGRGGGGKRGGTQQSWQISVFHVFLEGFETDS